MNSITIITIVVVALLTGIVFGLAWLAYSSCLKAYKVEVNQGKHDEEILKEYHSKKNKTGLVGTIFSYLALTALVGLFAVGIVYKARGENLSIGNQTALVIKSGSMSDYYNDELKEKYKSLEYKDLQFDIGDVCVFEKTSENTELVKGEVYGYKHKDIIITHRLIEVYDGNVYEFRGDNNSVSDPFVKGEDIIYHYTDQKIPGVGVFILYAQSYFGIWSLVGIISVAISSEIVYNKIIKISKQRYELINNPEEKVLEEPTKEELFDLDQNSYSKFIAFVLDTKSKVKKEPTAEAPSKTHEEKEGAEDEK